MKSIRLCGPETAGKIGVRFKHRGRDAIMFQPCGLKSYHPEDAANGWCPGCKDYIKFGSAEPLVAKLGEYMPDGTVPVGEQQQMEKKTMTNTSENKKTKTMRFERAEPVYLRKLVDRVGAMKAAELISVSRPLVNAALRDGVVTKRLEIAAKGVWMSKYDKAEEAQASMSGALIVKAQGHVLKTVEDIVRAAGGTTMRV